MAKVAYERVGAASVLTITREERRNAVDTETAEQLLEGYRAFEDDDEARANRRVEVVAVQALQRDVDLVADARHVIDLGQAVGVGELRKVNLALRLVRAEVDEL